MFDKLSLSSEYLVVRLIRVSSWIVNDKNPIHETTRNNTKR
jgi:hypothetical protein